MGNATQETLEQIGRTNGPTGAVFSWGGTASTAATLASYATAWSATTYAVGQVVKSGGLAYGCVVAGASATTPTGTGNAIRMGSDVAVWCYLGAPNARLLVIANLDAAGVLYFGSSAAITTSSTLGTVGAPIPPSPGAWTVPGGDPSLLYILGTTTFAVTVTT